ncbi:MAG: acyl-CoA thioesterase [Pseudomonadota bacterium]
MYPFVRLAWILAAARRKPPLRPDQASVLTLTAWPWDCDVYAEVNNGRQLTLFDLGRFDYGARVGLIPVLKKNGWGLVVGGSSIQYRRRLRPFQRFKLVTRFVCRDEKWFYAAQTTYRGETPCSQAVLRTAVVAGSRGTVPTDAVAEALGAPEWRPETPDWIAAWIEADRQRPWPPEEQPLKALEQATA